MRVDLSIEEEIKLLWDEGTDGIILQLREARDKDIPSFEINIHMDISFLLQLQKEIDLYLRGEQ